MALHRAHAEAQLRIRHVWNPHPIGILLPGQDAEPFPVLACWPPESGRLVRMARMDLESIGLLQGRRSPCCKWAQKLFREKILLPLHIASRQGQQDRNCSEPASLGQRMPSAMTWNRSIPPLKVNLVARTTPLRRPRFDHLPRRLGGYSVRLASVGTEPTFA